MTLTKISLNVTPEAKAALESVKQTNHFNATTQITKGIALLKYHLDAQNRGAEVRVYEKDGTYRVVEIMF
jgi:hypothetical protein